jgi:RHS repeat-associated protein
MFRSLRLHTICAAPVLLFILPVLGFYVSNSPPVAVNDSYTRHGNGYIGPLLANDYDPDHNPMTVNILTFPAHASIYAGTGSNFYYSLTNPSWTGTDSFTYQACDNLGACGNTATVTVNVVNNGPVAITDFYVIRGVTTIGPILANDSDADGDALTGPEVVTYPAHGTLYGLQQQDMKSFTPTSGYTGWDYFTYQVRDTQQVLSPPATVYLLILSGADSIPGACSCPFDPAFAGVFYPAHGVFRGIPERDLGVGASAPDPVNPTTGRETYAPPPDLTVYNANGIDVIWRQAYLGYQALVGVTGYGSPGLARGWVHNYDVTLAATSGSWGTVKLNYPSGAIENLTPQLDGSGIPTGVFTTVAGAPYLVTGIAGSPTGTWQSITITWHDQTKWKFTQFSGITYSLNQITNRTGQSLNFSWNANRALTQVTDGGSGSILLTLAYNSNGKLATAADAYNRQVSYGFTSATATSQSFLQTVSQVVTSGTSNPPARWTYGYTSEKGQQLNTATVPSPTGTGNSTATINYDSSGKVTSLVDANGNQRVYTYNASTTAVQVKDSASNVALSWTQKFDSSKRDTGITDAANHSTTIAYSDSANPLHATSITDRNNHATTFTYDQFGNVLTMTTPRNVTTTYSWSYTSFALGRVTSVQEGTKPATTITYYEPSGLVQTITRPAPNGSGTTTTTYTYDSLGNVLTVVGPGNNATTTITTTLNYTSDGGYSQSVKVGQPLTVTDNLGHVSHVRYDSQGRTTSATDALGNETDFTYNLVGQPETTTYPATGQTGTGQSHTTNSYLYVGGPPTTVTAFDESNIQVRQVTRAYGLEGEALSVSGSTEPVTNTYDALYRLKTLKDGNNNTTTYNYNNVGLVSSITMPGNEVTQFASYDNAGNLLQRVDGNNVTTNYLYTDSESRLTDIQYPASTSLNVHFAYDSFGRRSSMTDATGSQSYTYGNLDEVLSVTTTYSGLAAKTIAYLYYPDGSRQTITTPAGTFSYYFDAAGRPSSMTNPFSETTSWSYQDNDWLASQTLANGATSTYTQNALGQVTRLLNQIGANTISDFTSIGYDGVGDRNSVTANIPGATSLIGTTGYSYDSKDQITQETSTRNGGFTDNFVYDSAGNPTSFKGISKSYNSNNQQTGTGFSYDGNGNPTTYGGTTLTFDPESRLTSYGSVLTAGYNGDGLRGWKQNSSGRTYFLYDGIIPIIELNSSGSTTATNTFGADGLVSRNATSASVFYGFDSEGNVSQRSDSTGAVLSNHLFSAHGSVLSGTPAEPFGYKGQVGYFTDVETGLQLLTHRYYDPTTGRFLTGDPISYNGGINLYAYVANSPLNSIDPWGLKTGNDWYDWWEGVVDIRKSQKFWQDLHDESIQNGDWLTATGADTLNELLDCGGLPTIQESSEVLGSDASTGRKIWAGTKIVGVALSWYSVGTTQITGKVVGQTRTSRIIGFRNKFGAHWYTDENGFFLAVDRNFHRLHIGSWKGWFK